MVKMRRAPPGRASGTGRTNRHCASCAWGASGAGDASPRLLRFRSRPRAPPDASFVHLRAPLPGGPSLSASLGGRRRRLGRVFLVGRARGSASAVPAKYVVPRRTRASEPRDARALFAERPRGSHAGLRPREPRDEHVDPLAPGFWFELPLKRDARKDEPAPWHRFLAVLDPARRAVQGDVPPARSRAQ